MKQLGTFLCLLVLLAAPLDVARAADAFEVIAADAVPADAVKIDIKKMKYEPAAVEIEAGSVVIWTNGDPVPHNVHFKNPVEYKGDMLRAGQSVAIKFNSDGEYNYTCTPHPYMKGKVTVKPKS